MASQQRRQTRLEHRANQDVYGKGTRQISPGQAARGAYRGTTAPVRYGQLLGGRYSARGMLTAELLAGVGLVAIRAVEDYKPQQDGTLKGTIAHPSGQYGPLPILAGLLVWFFLLSFLAARGGTRAKVAVIAGGVTDLVLAMKSGTEITSVASTFSGFGTAKVPPGDWQTSGSIAGAPLSGGSTSSSASSSGSSSSSASSPSIAQQIYAGATTPLAKAPNNGPGALSQAWHWIDNHFFGGKPFFNGL